MEATETVEERELEVISTSLHPPSGHSSRKSSNQNQDSTFLEVPDNAVNVQDPSGSSPGSGSRRCSARVLSMNLQHTLRQLRKEQFLSLGSAERQKDSLCSPC